VCVVVVVVVVGGTKVFDKSICIKFFGPCTSTPVNTCDPDRSWTYCSQSYPNAPRFHQQRQLSSQKLEGS
jgi:hypothetical protein